MIFVIKIKKDIECPLHGFGTWGIKGRVLLMSLYKVDNIIHDLQVLLEFFHFGGLIIIKSFMEARIIKRVFVASFEFIYMLYHVIFIFILLF